MGPELSSGPDEVIAIYLLLRSSFLFLFWLWVVCFPQYHSGGADTAGLNYG